MTTISRVNLKIAEELVGLAKSLLSDGRSVEARRSGASFVIKDFLKGMNTHFDYLQNVRHRLEAMQFEETGVGGREEDEQITANIERIDHNLEVMDEMMDLVKRLSKRMR